VIEFSDPAARRTPDPFDEIRLLSVHALRGANYWSPGRVTRMEVNVGAYDDISSADAPWMIDRLTAALPGLVEHRCSRGRRGGFLERLRDGTYAAHITEHVALELQLLTGHNVGFGRTRGNGEAAGYTIVIEHLHEGVGLRAGPLALDVVRRAFADTLEGVADALDELRAAAGTVDAPSPRERVRCAITGGNGRAEARAALAERGVAPASTIIEVDPVDVLANGLEYGHSDVAIILDAELTNVPAPFRDPERAARLVATVADAIPRHGTVVVPASAHLIHDFVHDAGRTTARFDDSGPLAERIAAAVEVATAALGGRAT
jgi:cyanophycin synthetase